MVSDKRPYTRGLTWDEVVALQAREDPLTGCIEWIGARNGRGYGVVKRGGVTRPASRWAYWYSFGPIPPGVVVRHRCDNPPCVNPDHLTLGSQAENIQDSVSQNRHCHGESHGMSKLTEAHVMSIRSRYAGGESKASIARSYGMSRTAITDICNKKSWSHVE